MMRIKYSATITFETEVNNVVAKVFNLEPIITDYLKKKITENAEGPDHVELTDIKFSMEDDK